MRAKPLFRWTHAARTVRERMDLAVSVQKFFFMIVEEGLSAAAVIAKYPDEVGALKEAMTETGVAIDQPAWFSSLLR